MNNVSITQISIQDYCMHLANKSMPECTKIIVNITIGDPFKGCVKKVWGNSRKRSDTLIDHSSWFTARNYPLNQVEAGPQFLVCVGIALCETFGS